MAAVWAFSDYANENVCKTACCISLTQAAGRMLLEVCHLSSLAPAYTAPSSWHAIPGETFNTDVHGAVPI